MAVLLAAATPAAAQLQTTADDVRKNSRLHIGSLYLTPRFELKDMGVDTNVFSSATNPQSDFTFTLSPATELGLPIARRALVTAKVGIDVVYYKSFGSERSVNPDLQVRAEYYTPRITFFAQNKYLSSRQRPNFEIDLRSRRTLNDVTAGFDVKFSRRSQVRFAADRSAQRYAGDAVFLGSSLQETLDRNTVTYSATLRSQRTPKTAVFLEASVAHERFLFNGRRNADKVGFMPGVELAPRALINGTGKFGFRRFRPLDTTIAGFTGLAAAVDLGYTMLGSTRFGVQVDRDVDYSYDRAQSYYVKTGGGGSIRRQVLGDADVIVSAQRHRYAYRQSGTTGTASPEELTTNYAFDFGYRLNNGSRVGFAVAHWRRASDLSAARGYDGWRYGVSFVYGKK